MSMISAKDLGITEKEYRKMLDWAFGQDWMTKPVSECADAWNRRHDKIFTISGIDNIPETARRILKAWRARVC